MGFHVICISHTDGSGGAGIGRAVAEQLRLRYVDEELIEEAARLAQVDPALVAETEQKQSLLRRVLDALASAPELLGTATLAAGMVVPAGHGSARVRASRDDLRSMIRAAVYEVGKEGNAVIAAHAASLALASKPGVLRVLVTAPAEIRSERVGVDRKISPEAAADLLKKGDEGRRSYMKDFYEIGEELPTHYDLVINTEVLTPAQAAALIVTAANG